jgi:hypothetical protein
MPEQTGGIDIFMRIRNPFLVCSYLLGGIRSLISFAVVAVFLLSSSAARRWQVITWGPNTPEWNQILHVSGMRLGCSDTPGSCMREAASASHNGNEAEIFLAVPLKAETVDYGRQYAKLTRDSTPVVEIGVDDFTGQYERLLSTGSSKSAEALNSLIEGVKSGDSNLKFGATIYEDELPSAVLTDPDLPAAIRAKFDLVHLYLHFRSNALNTSAYVEQAKKLFPNAKIIIGVYAYDRISYIPCAKGPSRECTKQEELNYFDEALDADITLLKNGTVSGLEFYPGSFGNEDEWRGWNKPNICPGRKQECIENTKALRQLVLDKFK